MVNEGVINGNYDYVTCPKCGGSIEAKDWPKHYNQHTTDEVNSSPAQSVSKTSDDIQFNPGRYQKPKGGSGTGRSD